MKCEAIVKDRHLTISFRSARVYFACKSAMLHAIYTHVNAAIPMACTVHCTMLLLSVSTEAKSVFKTFQTGPMRILFFLSLVPWILYITLQAKNSTEMIRSKRNAFSYN